MPKRITGILFILTLLVFSAGIAHAITIETKKGDVIKGELGMTSIRIELELGGVLRIAPGEIADISGEGMDTFIAQGEVIWAGRDNHVGIKFVDLDESALNRLHNYIVEKVPEVTMEKR